MKEMEKEEIKNIIRRAIEKDDLNRDIRRLSLFGSFLRGTPREDSDIDLLVEFNPSARVGLFGLVGIQERLAEKVNREVDLLTPGQLSRYFRDEVLKEAEVIYER